MALTLHDANFSYYPRRSKRGLMLSKNFVLLISVLLVASLGTGVPNALADSSAGCTPPNCPWQPHTPGLRPSQPHVRLARPHAGQEESLNWGGYVVSAAAGSVSDVKGSWEVPSIACSRSTEYAAFWTGIDGFSDNTVEQTGILAECYRSHVYYYSWYEFYPSLPVYVTGQVPVKAGDVVYAEVSYASSTFVATITDQTTGATFSISQTDSSAQRSSAEWIAEAPSSGMGVLPLADFGVGYYGSDYTGITLTSYATVNGVTGAVSSFGSSVYELVMVTMNLTVKAQPSVLTSDGSSFSVTWKHS